MRVCVRCHIGKDEIEFRASKQTKSGLYPYCKKCCREVSTEYRRRIGIPELKRRPPDQIPDKKTCSKCCTEKPKDAFRIRVEKRDTTKFRYLNNTCKECDAAIGRANWSVKRKTPEGRRKNCESAKRAYIKRRDKAIAKMKEKRKTPEYKEMMRRYRERNKDKIRQQEIVTKQRYHVKNRDGLTDKYISGVLVSSGIAAKEVIEACPEIIEAKRIQILIKRKIKNHGNNDTN